MKVIAKLKEIEYVDLDTGIQNNPFPLQKLSFHQEVFPQHEMFSFHIPMARKDDEPFVVGRYYYVEVTEVDEEKKKEMLRYESI